MRTELELLLAAAKTVCCVPSRMGTSRTGPGAVPKATEMLGVLHATPVAATQIEIAIAATNKNVLARSGINHWSRMTPLATVTGHGEPESTGDPLNTPVILWNLPVSSPT